jgi:SHS2 domain-containing protein
MPYCYLEDIATADIAFKAWGTTSKEMFKAAADATMNVMVEDLTAIGPAEHKLIRVEEETIDLLLFQFLQEIIFYKDAENLLLRVEEVHIERLNSRMVCSARAYGETIDDFKHALNVDIKAVTFHRFEVKQAEEGWTATVVLDI